MLSNFEGKSKLISNWMFLWSCYFITEKEQHLKTFSITDFLEGGSLFPWWWHWHRICRRKFRRKKDDKNGWGWLWYVNRLRACTLSSLLRVCLFCFQYCHYLSDAAKFETTMKTSVAASKSQDHLSKPWNVSLCV